MTESHRTGPDACPGCRGPVEDRACPGCGRRFPTVAGLPDFRLASDRYLGLEDERAKAVRLDAIAATTDLEGVARAYYAITDDVDPARCARFLSHILGAEARGEAVASTLGDGGPILEIGCGTGGLLVAAARRGLRIEGADIASRWLVVARRRLEDRGVSVPLTAAEAERLPWSDGTFATVVADSVLEHCDDPGSALREWRRVLRPGGRLVLWSPNRFSLATDPHVRLLGVGFLPRRWALAYVGARRGGAWLPHLLSARRAASLAREAGFVSVRVGIPSVPADRSGTRTPAAGLALRLYDLATRTVPTRCILRAVGPLWSLEASSPGEPDSREVGGPRSSREAGRVGLAACLGAEVVAGGLGFLATVYLAGRLGPGGFGSLEVAAAGGGWLLVLVRGGLDQVVIREAARHPRLIPGLTRLLIGLRLAWAAIGLVLIAGIAGAIGGDRAGALLGSGLVLLPSAFVADLGPRVRNELPFLAMLQVIRAAGLAVAVRILVAGPGDLVAAATAPAIGELTVAVACAVRAGQVGCRILPRWRGRAASAFGARAAVAGLTRFGRVGLYGADAMALGLVAGPDAGAYAAGRRVAFAVVAVGIVVPTLLAPTLARAAGRGKMEASEQVGRGLSLLLGLSMPAAIGLAWLAEAGLPRLFGPEFRLSAGLAATIALRVPLLLGATWLQTALVALGREREACWVVLRVALVAIVGLPVAAARLGPLGIGLAVVAVEALGLGLAWAALRRLGIDPIRSVRPGPTIAGCAGMVCGMAMAGGGSPALVGLAGLAGYGLGLATAILSGLRFRSGRIA